mgnify:CR=1 FL=1
MKFKQITLVNFMRYKGENTIKFSTDDKKNVTAILGNNTVGKTTIAQAFRWGLYEDMIPTNYSPNKKFILLNKEVIACMGEKGEGEVRVEITVVDKLPDGEREYKFIRKQIFKRPITNPYSHDVDPSGKARLSVTISENGVPIKDGVIDNNYNKHKDGYVQDMINDMFPEKLSNYFFFDGERWNDSGNKTADIKKSINTILGITSALKLKEHLKDGTSTYKTTVYQKLNKGIKATSTESQTYQNKIESLEISIRNEEKAIEQYEQDIQVAERDEEQLGALLNNNRSMEEEQKKLKELRQSIESKTRHMNAYFTDFIKLFSSADFLFASELLSTVEKLLSEVDLEGKDIPGVTSDTIDWLLKNGKCICGEDLVPNHSHYQALMKLREEVYPNKIGGPAKILRARLNEWAELSSNLISNMHSKAEEYETFQSEINNEIGKAETIEERIDRSKNLEAVRKRYNQAKKQIDDLQKKLGIAKGKIDSYKESISSYRLQLENLEKQNEANKPYYRAIEYVKALYEKAAFDVESLERPTISQLNQIIAENFEKMFNSKEKYARLEKDYKIHMYYRSMGGFTDYEEHHLSNGELIAVNFVYIVSILELAKMRQQSDLTNKEGILQLPLVLDAPFSNLSNENTNLVAEKLPAFAEQVIIFMLDKDWEASGLQKYALPEFCYRITKEASANNSTITSDMGGGL